MNVAFENNTKMVLKMYGKDKMLDALNVVVNEMHEYKKQAIELAKQLEEHQQKKAANSSGATNEVCTCVMDNVIIMWF